MKRVESLIAKTIRNEGFQVFEKGWPDLLVGSPDREVWGAIEVKQGNDAVRPHQREMHKVFEHLKIPVLTLNVNYYQVDEVEGPHDFEEDYAGKVLERWLCHLASHWTLTSERRNWRYEAPVEPDVFSVGVGKW